MSIHIYSVHIYICTYIYLYIYIYNELISLRYDVKDEENTRNQELAFGVLRLTAVHCSVNGMACVTSHNNHGWKGYLPRFETCSYLSVSIAT